MKYEIWSNVSRRPEKFLSGYQSGDLMKISWHGMLTSATEYPASTLEFLFAKFNKDDRPNGKIAHSLSIGDVVVLDGKAHAAKIFGWDHLDEFNPVVGNYE